MKQPQFREHRVGAFHQADRPDHRSVEIGDPGVLPRGIEPQHEGAEDLTGQPFVGPVPAIFFMVDARLSVRDPPKVAGFEGTEASTGVSVRMMALSLLEHAAHVADRPLKPHPAAHIDRGEQAIDLLARRAFELLEFGGARAGEREPEAAGIFGAGLDEEPAAVAKPRDDPTDLRLVHREPAPDLGGGASWRRRMADLLEHPRFRQGRLAAGKAPV